MLYAVCVQSVHHIALKFGLLDRQAAIEFRMDEASYERVSLKMLATLKI